MCIRDRSRDFSETNYSSSRLSLLEDREHWRVVQKYLIDNFHYRIFKEWLALASLSGDLDFIDYSARPERYCQPRWTPPAQHFVDPLKEVKAYREAEQAGYMTKSQVIAASNGGDYDDIVAELAREKEIAEEAGVVLDKDQLGLPVPEEQLELPIAKKSAPTTRRKKRTKA